MRVLENSIVKPLPTDKVIAEKELEWGIKLPEPYKSFLKKYNGGIPEDGSVETEGRSFIVVRFLGIIEDYDSKLGWYDIEAVETQIAEKLTDNRDNETMDRVPIAEIVGGDYVCLNLGSSGEYGSVCVWDSKKSREFKPVTKLIAKSFGEFLNMVK